MPLPLESRITEAEDRLAQAMLDSDVAALDALLSPELVFTNHLGKVLDKQADLDAHASGAVEITELTRSAQKVRLIGDVAVVTVAVHIAGSFGGSPASGDFRFMRVWAQGPGDTWQVVAGNSSLVD